MKGTPQEASKFAESGAKVIWPSMQPHTISDRMRKLIVERHVSTPWIQFELAKLIPGTHKMESEKFLWALGGFGFGMFLLILILGVQQWSP